MDFYEDKFLRLIIPDCEKEVCPTFKTMQHIYYNGEKYSGDLYTREEVENIEGDSTALRTFDGKHFALFDLQSYRYSPSIERMLARLAATFANLGFYTLVYTTSDWVIREINSLILLKNPSLKAVRERYGYVEGELLKASNVLVEVYSSYAGFERTEVDDRGFVIESIDKEIELTNRLAFDIEQEWRE